MFIRLKGKNGQDVNLNVAHIESFTDSSGEEKLSTVTMVGGNQAIVVDTTRAIRTAIEKASSF